MGKVMYYLVHYPLDLDIRSQSVRFDKCELDCQKIVNMKVAHRWLIDFFTNPKCFEAAAVGFQDEDKWFSMIKFSKTASHPAMPLRWVFVERQRCYAFFSHWKKSTGIKTDVKLTTFEDDLKLLGIQKVRREITRGHQKTKWSGFEFRQWECKKKLTDFYSLKEQEIKLQWTFLDKDEFDELIKYKFRFRDSSKAATKRFGFDDE